MTSKEALLKIEAYLAYDGFQEELKAIAKDLEVLENLRNHIEKIDIITSYCEKDIETIKEWLNDKYGYKSTKEDEEWGQYE